MSVNAPVEEVEQRGTPASQIVLKITQEMLRSEAGMSPPSERSRASCNQFIIFLNVMISTAVLMIIASGATFYFGKQKLIRHGPLTTPSTFLVKPATGVADIADQLKHRGLISNASIFRLGVRVYGNDGALKAGEYEIEAGASMYDIMELLKSGKSVQYSLSIPEGLTVEQTWQRIADQEVLTGDMPKKKPPEGSLIADTQRFTRGASRQKIVNKMLTDQKELVESIWARRAPNLPLSNINEFVTLASIVEKETARGDERSRVAAVFINRLNNGMRLQSDPTIIYGIFGGKGKPADRPIYRSDIDKQTPYNTYTIKGLPPTPIANPGKASLEAVANPSKTKELYFVADGTGGHVFSTTLDEHNENVAHWRAFQRKVVEDEKATGETDLVKRSATTTNSVKKN